MGRSSFGREGLQGGRPWEWGALSPAPTCAPLTLQIGPPALSLSCSSDYTELSLSPLVWHLPSKYHGEGGPGSGSLTPELAANGEEKSTFKSLMSHKYMGKYFCRPGRMRKQEEGK